MPNPNGVNAFDRFAAEEPYGAVKAMEEKLRDVPLDTAPALNAPQRLKRRATKGNVGGSAVTAPPGPAEATLSAGLPSTPPVGDVWAEIASHPEASDLVKQLAAEAYGSGSAA